MAESRLSCDYLVVGAGTACLSFVDVVLTRRKEATFVIVDRFSAPGGHWTKAYPFVRLHQPSAYYGVNSLPLSKPDRKGNEPFDQSVRASAKEICEYYRKVVDNFEATGRVRTFFEANYEGEAKSNSINSNRYNDPTAKIRHAITTKDGGTILVDCVKCVRCESNVVVPSMRAGPPFPIPDSAQCVAPNKLPELMVSNSLHEKYLVVGGGKTGIDAIIYLLNSKKVSHDQITWIVPRPSWCFVSNHLQRKNRPGKYFWKDAVERVIKPLITANSAEEAFLNMEKLGVTQRIDPNDGHVPVIFKGATVNQHEMNNLQKIKNFVTLKGRVTSITESEVVFANGAHSIPFSPSNTLIVDCTVEETYGYMSFEEDFKFFNPHKIRLGALTSMFNPSHTSAQIGFLESEYGDTAAADELKNSFLYFPRGKLECSKDNFLSYFLLTFYAHQKTDSEFEKCPTYRKWVLTQRTDRNQPGHHGGILPLLWAVFGPLKLPKHAKAFRDKMETGGYKDFPNHPMPGRPRVDSSKHEANLRYPPNPKETRRKTDVKRTLISKKKSTKRPEQYKKSSKETSNQTTLKTLEVHC